MNMDAITFCLKRYKEVCQKIITTRFMDKDDKELTKLQERAKSYIAYAMKAGYDPVAHLEVYRRI